MAVYKLNEIMKTLDKLFRYNIKTTEKVATLKWQDLDFIIYKIAKNIDFKGNRGIKVQIFKI